MVGGRKTRLTRLEIRPGRQLGGVRPGRRGVGAVVGRPARLALVLARLLAVAGRVAGLGLALARLPRLASRPGLTGLLAVLLGCRLAGLLLPAAGLPGFAAGR